MTDEPQEKRRLIYGRRQGRPLKSGAREAFETVLPALRLDLATLNAPFPGLPKLALEIGFGGGEHLAAQAAAHKDTGFIGAEPFLNGVAKLAAAVKDLGNVRIHHGDARDVLDGLPDASLDKAWLLFPDPWPKPRHNKRRFVSQPNLVQLARTLKPGAIFRVASDIPDYVRWTLVEIAAFNRARGETFTWQARQPADWRIRPSDWPGTRYEAKALIAGRVPAYLEFRRV